MPASPGKRKWVTGVGRPFMRTQDSDAFKGSAWRANAGNTYQVATFNSPGGGTVQPPHFHHRHHNLAG